MTIKKVGNILEYKGTPCRVEAIEGNQFYLSVPVPGPSYVARCVELKNGDRPHLKIYPGLMIQTENRPDISFLFEHSDQDWPHEQLDFLVNEIEKSLASNLEFCLADKKDRIKALAVVLDRIQTEFLILSSWNGIENDDQNKRPLTGVLTSY